MPPLPPCPAAVRAAFQVFCIAIIAALLEIGQFVQFIIGGRCDLINELIVNATKVAPAVAKALGGDDQCFDVVATLDTGCWTLFAASVVSLLVGQLVMRTCHKALRERTAAQGGDAGGRRESVEGASEADKVAYLLRVEDEQRERNPSKCRNSIRGLCLKLSNIFTSLGFLISEDLTPEEIAKRRAAGKS